MKNDLHGPGRRAGLRGRKNECALLDELVSAIRRGDSRSLVLLGEAGIGKTALLECLVESATDLTVINAVGVESEMELPFASLHQVCAPLLDRLGRLPPPQRDALQVAFGLNAGPAPDRFLVGLAVLGLLSVAAEKRPLLCVVDDAQWLDRASALALAFVAHRLLAEPIGMVFGARVRSEEFQHLPELDVQGLANPDARALLSSELRFTLDERVRDRIIAETRGNPLALLELPRGLTAAQLAGGFALPGGQPLSGRIEETFVRRLDALSDSARCLVLLAAAEPVGDPLLLWRASERLGIAVPAVDAETDGLLTIDQRVTFRHPLVRSAVYRSAAAPERRAVHLALAEATDREVDPDRRAWHLAAAAAGPDEQVAVELGRSAIRAQTRGGFAAAAAFLQRAVALTEDPSRHADRALAAAEASLRVGAFDTALGLIARAEMGPLDEFQSARVDLLRGHVALVALSGSDAPRLLLNAARQLESFDLKLARDTYLNALGAAKMAGPLARETLIEVCLAVQALPSPAGALRPVDLLLDGQALLTTEGRAAATPTLQRAAKALADIGIEEFLEWGWQASSASALVWDPEGMRSISARQVELIREAGALAAMPGSLSTLAIAACWTGDLAEATSLVAESESVAAATASGQAPYARMRLRALQGREAEVSALVAGASELAGTGQGIAESWAQWAAAVLYNGLARYEEAASAAEYATSDTADPTVVMWALPELIEAVAHTGDAELARGALQRLTDTTRPCDTDLAIGMEARCRALLSDGIAADELYREAVDRLSRTSVRPELARAHLIYGEWLRREGRQADAIAQLRSAHDQCTTMGMEAFADRARKELFATGEIVVERRVETRGDLTAQERQIARFACDGFTNAEIGARLFLSPRTVEWHLGNVFTKLRIRSRRELAGALASFDLQPIPGLS